MTGDRECIETTGIVVAEHRGGMFTIEATIGGATRTVLARCAGRMVQAHIRLLPGDTVTIEVSAYDPTRGRITYRGVRRDRGAA